MCLKKVKVYNIYKKLYSKKSVMRMVFQLKFFKKQNNLVSPLINELNNQAYYKGIQPNSPKTENIQRL